MEKAPIVKTNFRYGGAPKNNGRPEYIYYRFKFKNPPADHFDELTIYTVIDEEKNIAEEDFIFVSHNSMNRYFISKSNNPELFKVLKDLAYNDYGDNLEQRP